MQALLWQWAPLWPRWLLVRSLLQQLLPLPLRRRTSLPLLLLLHLLLLHPPRLLPLHLLLQPLPLPRLPPPPLQPLLPLQSPPPLVPALRPGWP